jgi:dCMP deaminase
MHTVINDDGSKSEHCIRTTHAEQNAIVQAARFGVSTDGAALFCKMVPCYVCAKLIITAGIKRVVAENDYHVSKRSKEIFKKAGVKLDILNKEVEKY